MSRPIALALSLALASALIERSASAHDYWPEPVVDRIEGASAHMTGHLWVGEALVAEMERGPERARVEVLRVFGAEGMEDRTATLGDATEPPFLRLELPASAPRLVHLQRGITRIELPADRFNAYLRSEGLLRAFRERRRLGESAQPGRERYGRCVSALVSPSIEPAPASVFAADTGCPIAILPARDPSHLRAGAALAFSVRFRGQPLADVAVDLVQRDAQGRVHSMRVQTDRQGLGRVRLPTSGFSVLRTVTMARAEVPDAEWESWWASYSFTNARPATP